MIRRSRACSARRPSRIARAAAAGRRFATSIFGRTHHARTVVRELPMSFTTSCRVLSIHRGCSTSTICAPFATNAIRRRTTGAQRPTAASWEGRMPEQARTNHGFPSSAARPSSRGCALMLAQTLGLVWRVGAYTHLCGTRTPTFPPAKVGAYAHLYPVAGGGGSRAGTRYPIALPLPYLSLRSASTSPRDSSTSIHLRTVRLCRPARSAILSVPT
jgi:hypothetical protein